MRASDIRTVSVVRYVQPLREGGSLPAVVEADDDFPYVIKFRGAGQGPKALIAELIGGEMARLMGLRVPEIVFMELDESFSRLEPDQEIQDLLRFSIGLNLGLHYLSGAITYDPLVSQVQPLEASLIVLLDSLITNIDRTARNTNMLIWKRELWLIDHGASLYFHHSWTNWEEQAQRLFPMVKNHVLLPKATALAEAADAIRSLIKKEDLEEIAAVIPDSWLSEEGNDMTPEHKREAYVSFLWTRLRNLDQLTKEAADAREAGL